MLKDLIQSHVSPVILEDTGKLLQLMSMCYARKIFSCCTTVHALLMHIWKLVACIVMLLVVR